MTSTHVFETKLKVQKMHTIDKRISSQNGTFITQMFKRLHFKCMIKKIIKNFGAFVSWVELKIGSENIFMWKQTPAAASVALTQGHQNYLFGSFGQEFLIYKEQLI